ncbi:MAG: pilus assembly protein PilM [Candidatus Omnitrophica bacterium]|nr:pilus assembly protein PilM [Candidatus Omnitrophota bacterium]
MVILQFTKETLKLLRTVRKGQKTVLLNLTKKSIAGLSDEAISNTIQDLISQEKIRKVNQLVISIPRHLVTVRNLRFPSVDDAELQSMVGLQAGKQLPYPTDELIWDFKVIEKNPDGYSDIFFVIAHRNAIDRFLNILADCKLRIKRIVLSSEALLGWYLTAYDSRPKDASLVKTGAVIDIDTSYIDVVILRGERLEFSRSFPFKRNPEEMAEEIRKTFSSYERESSKKISFVVLTGIEERAAILKACIENMYKDEKIDFAHPLKVLSMDYRETRADYFDLSRDTSFSHILGIAYNSKDIVMNLLPSEEKENLKKQARRKMLAKATLLLSVMICVLSAVFINGLINTTRQVNLINSKIKETAPRVKKLKEISQNIALIREHLNMKGSSVDVIREVYKIVPQAVSVSVLDFELGRSLTIRGVSSDLSSVFKFSSNLGKSDYFEECQIKYAQKRIVKTKEVVDFELSCRLRKIKDESR